MREGNVITGVCLSTGEGEGGNWEARGATQARTRYPLPPMTFPALLSVSTGVPPPLYLLPPIPSTPFLSSPPPRPGQMYPSIPPSPTPFLPLPQPGPVWLCGAGGMPLAFTQEDFLVLKIILTRYLMQLKKDIFQWRVYFHTLNKGSFCSFKKKRCKIQNKHQFWNCCSVTFNVFTRRILL